MRKTIVLALVLGLLAVEHAVAQQSNWQNLEQIGRGERVQVTDTHLRVHNGEFAGFSDNDLSLYDSGKVIIIPRADVHRVTLLGRGTGRHVLRGMLWGAGLGAGLVGGIGAIAARNHGGVEAGGVAGGALIGAGIGALVGAAKQPHLNIYRADKKPRK